jgi:hypothetical protein
VSNKNKIIYLFFIPELNISKIGISRNATKRLSQLQTGCPYQIQLIKTYSSEFSTKIERVLHRSFRTKKVDSSEYALLGEWFNLEIDSILKFEEICSEIEKNIIYLKKENNPFIK